MSPTIRLSPITPTHVQLNTDGQAPVTGHTPSTASHIPPDGLPPRTAQVAGARPRFRLPGGIVPGQRPDPLNIQDPRNLDMLGIGTVLVAGIVKACSDFNLPTLSDETLEGMNRYINHLIKEAKCSQNHVLIAGSYLNRLPLRVKGELQGERLITGCVMLAMKYGNDVTYSPDVWSDKTGFSKAELMEIERSILQGLDHDMSVGDVGPEPSHPTATSRP